MIKRALNWLFLAAMWAAGSIAMCCSSVPAYGQTTRPAPINAAWYQPSTLAPTWKARGINTFVGLEVKSAADVDSECKAIAAAGMDLVIPSTHKDPAIAARLRAHFGDANVVAVHYKPDEPNGGGEGTPKTPGQVTDEVVALRAFTGPRPILLTLDAWQMLYQSDAKIAAYCASADWIAADQYPANRGEADPLSTIPTYLARLKRLAPGKRLFACLETADMGNIYQSWANVPDASGTPPGPRMHPPSALEADAEARQADDFGAEYLWFSHTFGKDGWKGYDGTPPLVAAAVTKINARRLAATK